MVKLLIPIILCNQFICSCSGTPKSGCGKDESNSKSGRAYNVTRLKYGVPIIHDYLCLESVTDKMESWGLAKEIQDTIRGGYHDGKGIFHDPEGILEEKDIFRKRIDDSTFIMLGMITEVSKDLKMQFSSIWYDTLDARAIGLARKPAGYGKRTARAQYKLTIQQADSILQSWGTSRNE